MLEEITRVLDKYHPNHKQFRQAVFEVFDDIAEFYYSHDKYQKYSILERMIEPDRIITFRVCWEDDKQNIRVNRGYRVQFNNALGAYKGGLRFHPSVNVDTFKFLGFEQCFKNALTGMPMGGAKGGSDFNPKECSDNEVMRFCKSYMEELYRHIGDDIDVPAGDINVGAREIGYMFGHYIKLVNKWNGVLTGKGPDFGGSCGREEATGYGCVYFLEEMIKAHDDKLKDKKVIISGAGNVALHAAEKALEEGAKVLSVSDSKGTLCFKEGITPEQLLELKQLKLRNYGALKDYNSPKAEYKQGVKPWSIEADIALPCATQNEVDAVSMNEMVKNKVSYIAEGANMPLTSEAQDIVAENNIIYGPGKAANAGGVAVSGLERTQNAEMRSWTLERVESELKDIMKTIHRRCTDNIERKDGIYNYRKGANINSFKKIADSLVSFGIK